MAGFRLTAVKQLRVASLQPRRTPPALLPIRSRPSNGVQWHQPVHVAPAFTLALTCCPPLTLAARPQCPTAAPICTCSSCTPFTFSLVCPFCSAPSVSYGSTNLYMRGALEAQTRANLDKASPWENTLGVSVTAVWWA